MEAEEGPAAEEGVRVWEGGEGSEAGGTEAGCVWLAAGA